MFSNRLQILALTQIVKKTYGKYPQMDTTYDSREYHKLVVFFVIVLEMT